MRTGAVRCRLAGAAALAVLALAWAPAASAQVITQTQALDFGRIALGSGSGSVTVTPSGGVSCGPHFCLGSHQSGSFQVVGLALTTWDITFSSGDLLTRQGGSETLALENLVDSHGGSITLGLLGTGSFTVGGDLVLPSTSTGGDYVGTYEVFLENP